MHFDCSDDRQAQDCAAYLMRLARKGKAVEVVDASRQLTRSLPQNRYLHVILAYFAGEYGCTADEAKAIFKRVNRGIFVRDGKAGAYVRSTADLSQEEMSAAIDAFILFAADGGITIPPAEEYKAVFSMMQEAERNRMYI